MYIIYSMDNCRYCVMAEELIKSTGRHYEKYNVRDPGILDQLTEKLGYKPKTAPQIWFDNQHIGGFDQLQDFIEPFSKES